MHHHPSPEPLRKARSPISRLYDNHVHPQLPLQFDSESALTFDAYWAGANDVAVQSIRALASGRSDDQMVYIWGASNVGKTHLLSAACHCASGAGFRIAYLTGQMITGIEVLEGLADFDLVCIDDMQGLPETSGSELAMFSLINALRASQGRLLVAASVNPSQLAVSLADLRTRLSWGMTFQIQATAPENLPNVLARQFHNKGLLVADDVLQYILTHCPRDLRSLTGLADELARASLQAKRKITIPLVRSTLAEQHSQDSQPQ